LAENVGGGVDGGRKNFSAPRRKKMSIGKLSEKKSRVGKKFQGKIKISIFQKKVGRATFGSKIHFRPPRKSEKNGIFWGICVSLSKAH
jgi:hypothetical protein